MKQKICHKAWMSRLTACAATLLLALSGAVQYYAYCLPDHFYTQADRPLTVATALPVTIRSRQPSVPQVQEAQVRLFGMIPVKTVALTTVSPVEVCVGGEPFGIRMQMAGVMVVSLSEIDTPAGVCCPAADAGLAVGDMIQAVNGRQIAGNRDLQEAVEASHGAAVTVTLLRENVQRTVSVQPVWSVAAKRWQAGMWVRDSIAGIGTVTYYLPGENGTVQFAGLGHAVCDADTGEQIPLASGDVIPVDVGSILPGAAGHPGELRGRFDTAHPLGVLFANTACGVFGTWNALPQKPQMLPLGFRQDIEKGEAVIYTTLDGSHPCSFTVEIEEIRQHDAAMRNLVVHVTDPDLLAQTGGIVQGMSGSPIVQNGRLIGAVTHVFVKDPSRGYGIFAENMYAQTAAYAGSAEHAAAADKAAAG